jgi:thiol-disulfide isomerase/thioredoxin
MTMRVAVLSAAVLLSAGVARANDKASCPEPGLKAPPFAILMANGQEGVSLRKALADKVPVVLGFWAHWCEPCKEELPVLQKLSKELAGRANFVLVHVGPDEAKMKSELTKLGITIPSASDDTMKKKDRYCANDLPLTFLLDGQGVVKKKFGAMTVAEFEKSLLAELSSLGVKK